jgi:DNA recombination protein RmuC
MTASTIILAITIAVLIILGAIVLLMRRKGGDETFSLLQQQIATLQEQIRSSLEGNQARLNELLHANTETHKTVGERLDGVQRAVGDRLDNAARVVGELGIKMTKVEEVTKRVLEVGQDISGLQQILRAPKIRGGLGEMFLADLLSQMLPRENYELQYLFSNGEQVDAVVKTAHGMVPVDSKFPMEDFERLAQAKTDEDRKTYRRAFVDGVKRRVNETAKYIRPGEGTFDFALMYIPAENVYYEIITRDDDLGEETSPVTYALKKRVIPVSPNTFYAYLNTILIGLRGMRVEKFVTQIIKDMGKIRTEFDRFKEDFLKLGKHLSDAHSSFDKADKHLDRFDAKLQAIDQPVIEEGEDQKVIPENLSPPL